MRRIADLSQRKIHFPAATLSSTNMVRKPVQDFFLFLIGSSLFAAGIFLFANQVTVGSGHGIGLGVLSGRTFGRGTGAFFGGLFPFGAGQGFGLLMIPFGTGVALLLADTYRKVGWFLVCASAAALGVTILQSLFFEFRPASLWSLMAMIFMIGAGAGLMFKSLRAYPEEEPDRGRRSENHSDQQYIEIKKELEDLRSRLDKE
jgi:hypothetical protein